MVALQHINHLRLPFDLGGVIPMFLRNISGINDSLDLVCKGALCWLAILTSASGSKPSSN
jgi:hypothetical protein